MPCAQSMASMDDEQPALCHAHCQTAYQSADNFQISLGAVLVQLAPVLTVAGVAPTRVDAGYHQAPLLRRATAPPIAVRHCCFRI